MSVFFRTGFSSLTRNGVCNGVRNFHRSGMLGVNVGDAFPGIEVMEDSPGNKVALGKELQKHSKAIVVGVPAAFSPACSATHIPGYIEAKSGLPTYIVSINDPFVMKAWGQSLSGSKEAGLRFMADSSGALTKALKMEFDSEAIFGNKRSKRYALIVENGKVSKVFVEPDNTGVKESTAKAVLSALG